jgi:hypothetical protein
VDHFLTVLPARVGRASCLLRRRGVVVCYGTAGTSGTLMLRQRRHKRDAYATAEKAQAGRLCYGRWAGCCAKQSQERAIVPGYRKRVPGAATNDRARPIPAADHRERITGPGLDASAGDGHISGLARRAIDRGAKQKA